MFKKHAAKPDKNLSLKNRANILGMAASAKNDEMYDDFEQASSAKDFNRQHGSKVSLLNLAATARSNITYQNFVFNDQWTEHQPTKVLTFKHHIDFGVLTEGQYLSSRVVLDEGAIKTFIKTSKDNIKEWQKAPIQANR